MAQPIPDPAGLERALREIQVDAARLPWARERPWRVDSHAVAEGPWLVIDLHDLSVPLALRVLEALERHDVGAARLVTGSGRHGGGRSPLREAVIGEAEARGWRVVPLGRARLEVVRDPSRHPLGRGVPLVVWLLLGLVVAALAGSLCRSG